MSLIEFAIDRFRVVLSILVFIVVAGIISYVNIPKEYFPDVEVPFFSIRVSCRGISVHDSERLILRPLEQKLRSLEGLKEMSSTAYEGGGNVILEFETGVDLDRARSDVKDKIDEAKPDLPSEVDDPVLDEMNLSDFPVLLIKLSGDIPDRVLYKIGNDLKDEIEAKVSSVLKAGIVGDRDEIIELRIDPAKMHNYAMPVDQIKGLFSANNKLISAGVLESQVGRFPIKVEGSFLTVSDIFNAPLIASGDSVVKVSDVASLHRTFLDATSFARDRGKNAVVLEITKRSGENIISTVKNVMQIVADFSKNFPSGMNVSFAQDTSKQILTLLNDLMNHLLLAFLLVMVVIVYALGWRSALLVAVSLPGSFLSGILFLYVYGYTINMVVLFALIFSIGMLVDGSIIVVEYADRKMEEGCNAYDAYKDAALRMKWPVITSIGTILIVFIPLLFWPGMIGGVLKFLPITVVATLSASIAMALIFVPCLGAIFGKAPINHSEESYESVDNILAIKGITGHYVNLLNKALNHPKMVVSAAIALLLCVSMLYKTLNKGVEFFPTMEPDFSVIHVCARGNLSVYEKDALVKQVEKVVIPMKELKSVYAKSGSMREANMKSSGKNSSSGEDEIGTIMIEYHDWDKRRSVVEITADILKKCKLISGVRVEIEDEKKGSPKKAIEVQIVGNDFNSILNDGKRLKAFMLTLPEISVLQDAMPVPGIQWEFHIDRAQALKFGANVSTIGTILQLATRGIEIGSFRPDDSTEEIDIVVRFPKKYRTLEEIDNMKLYTSLGLMPISNFVKRIPTTSITTLTRADGRPAVMLKADVKKGMLPGNVLLKIQKWSQEHKLSRGVEMIFKGDSSNQKESGDFLIAAFGVAVIMMILIMLVEFNSFFSTFLVLSSIVMSTIGVFAGLLLRQMTFIVTMGGIGIIGLAGIIVSNNIILIDTYDHLRKIIRDGRDCILRTCAQRLRPVFLTKITVILGMLPIMFGINIDIVSFDITVGAPSSQMWVLLATCIVSGVLFASLLTLFFTPCVLMLRENFRAKKLLDVKSN